MNHMSATIQDNRVENRKEIEVILKSDDQTVRNWLRFQNDSVLGDILKGKLNGWQTNKPFDKDVKITRKVKDLASSVLKGRDTATNVIRLALAKVFQHPNAATHSRWHIVPCRTATGTIGVLDIAHGTAWDTTIACPVEAKDLGLVDEVHADATGCGGTVVFDGEVVQKDGTAVIDGKMIFPSMPPNWQQIAIPTWRGYKGDGHHTVPSELYTQDVPTPRLAAYGLMTIYGKPGIPRRFLADFQKQSATKDWLFADFERINLSWWKITNEETSRLFALVEDWTQQVIQILEQKMTTEEKAMEPHKHPSLLLKFSKILEENQFAAICEKRSAGAEHGAKLALEDTGIWNLWGARSWPGIAIGNRSADHVVRLLTTIIYNRLIPIADGLKWMIQFSDPDRCYNIGPMQKNYEESLRSVGVQIGNSLCCDFPKYEDVLNKMVEIHLENGPRFFTDTEVDEVPL